MFGQTARTAATGAVAAVIFGAMLAAPLPAQAAAGSASARAIVDAVMARTTQVSSYTANLSLHVALHSFPFLHLTINGDMSYQQPGQYDVKMHTLPALAKAFQNVSGDAGDPDVWLQKYNITTDATVAAPAGQIALRMTQKNQGEIEHAEAFIDTSTMTVARMEWFYRHGGHISIDDHYAQVGNVLMVDHQTAEIAMPGIRATASADLTNYAMQMDLADNAGTHKAAALDQKQ